MWDFRERGRFNRVVRGYLVNAHGNTLRAARFLASVRAFIQRVARRATGKGAELLRRHFRPGFALAEMPPGTGFIGMTKPKHVYRARDGSLQARSRSMFIRFRDERDRYDPWPRVRDLVLHEMAHVMRNDVLFDPVDNHRGDFYDYARRLKKAARR